MLRTAVAASVAICLACPPMAAASAPSRGETIAANWAFEPSFTLGATVTRDYSDFPIGKLVPRSLWRTDAPALTESGKLLFSPQDALISMTNRATYCEPKRTPGSHDITCLVDGNGDGLVEGYFRHSPAEDMTQTVRVGKIRPLSAPVRIAQLAELDVASSFDVTFKLTRSQLDIAKPSIFGQFCIQADRIAFLSGIYGKTRENCTNNWNQELSRQPVVYGQFGYKFTILDVQNEAVTFRIDTVN